MITFERFSRKIGGCDVATFEMIRAQAKRKLAVIIELFGDENGARLTDDYLLQLMTEELRSQIMSEVLFSVFTHSKVERERPATAGKAITGSQT